MMHIVFNFDTLLKKKEEICTKFLDRLILCEIFNLVFKIQESVPLPTKKS